MRKGLSVILGVAMLFFAFSASAAVVTDGLVSWWKFDETNDTTAADSWGSDGDHYNTGTLNDFDVPACWTTNTAGTASSGALHFDAASSNYVEVPYHSSLGITNAITVEAWVKPDVLNIIQKIVDKVYTSGFELIFWDDGTLYFELATEDAIESISTTGFETDTWYHVAGVYDRTNVYLYVNGSEKSSNPASGNLKINNGVLAIGSSAGAATRFFDGTIDDVRIYNRALTQPQIQQNIDAIPEPSTLLLLGGGLFLLGFGKRFQRTKKN